MIQTIPSKEEAIHFLEMTLQDVKEADCYSDFDWALGRLQNWVKPWPQILDENGSL